MPEGDTLWRIARTLNQVLAGYLIRGARCSVAGTACAELVGRRVREVRAMGKNLLIYFDHGWVLHTHLRMHGSWHVYRPGEKWQRPVSQARVELDVGHMIAVCFNAPIVRLLPEARLDRDEQLQSLGPDILAGDFATAEAVRRLRERSALSIGEALMIQSAVAGIGNVYKSETLFLCRVHPQAPVSALSDAALGELLHRARALMQRNVAPEAGLRTTHFGLGSRYWVYLRSGEPCLQCGAEIRMLRQGAGVRSTYFCPRCQPAPAAHEGSG